MLKELVLPPLPAPYYKSIGTAPDLYSDIQIRIFGRACAEAQRQLDLEQMQQGGDYYVLHDSAGGMTYAEAVQSLEKETSELRAELEFLKSEGKK